MTIPNQITILRILLIPVFVALAVYYSESVTSGMPNDALRWGAVITFVVAAASDGIDGFIARRYNMGSRLGAVLDPLADKGLVISALLTLSIAHWSLQWSLPLWFPILVITRDIINIMGAFIVQHVAGDVRIQPRWTGKVATFVTMVAIAWILVEVPVNPRYLVWVAGVFVFVSGAQYVLDGTRQVHDLGHTQAGTQEKGPTAA